MSGVRGRGAGVGCGWLVLAGSLGLAACAQTSRIDVEDLSHRRLRADNRGVVLMRVGAASQKCLHVAVLLGVRAGEGYRRVKVLGVANVRALGKAPVAEVELDAGEYHVVGYSCTNDKGSKVVADDTGPGSALFRTSYAHFAVGPGDVLNVGYLHFHAESDGDSLFGRPIKVAVGVSDWPLTEIERFARERPAVYALMATRLMTVEARPAGDKVTAQACVTWKSLAAGGKVQHVPSGC